MTNAPTPERKPPNVLLVSACETPVWGLAARHRLRRQCRHAGVTTILDEPPAVPPHPPLVILRADFALDDGVLRGLLASADHLLVVDGENGRPRPVAAHVASATIEPMLRLLTEGDALDADRLPAAIRVATPRDLASGYSIALRRKSDPYALRLTPASAGQIEWRVFRAAYKGATDFVTKFAWPLPAFFAARWCARRRISPNMVTTASLALVILAFVLFWHGWFIPGLIAGWAMTFLDTVDGKLARCTLTSSQWGNIYDHGIDLLHPPFWWWAWYVGLEQAGVAPSPALTAALAVILVGYVAGRLNELVFKRVFRIQIHIWRPIDFAFRAVTARRNPNLAILTGFIVFQAPAAGFVAVAVWTIVCQLFHWIRLAQAWRRRRRGGRIVSYLTGADGLVPA